MYEVRIKENKQCGGVVFEHVGCCLNLDSKIPPYLVFAVISSLVRNASDSIFQFYYLFSFSVAPPLAPLSPSLSLSSSDGKKTNSDEDISEEG